MGASRLWLPYPAMDHWYGEWHLTKASLMRARPWEFWTRNWAGWAGTEKDEPTSCWVHLDLSCKAENCQKLAFLLHGLEKHGSLSGEKKGGETGWGQQAGLPNFLDSPCVPPSWLLGPLSFLIVNIRERLRTQLLRFNMMMQGDLAPSSLRSRLKHTSFSKQSTYSVGPLTACRPPILDVPTLPGKRDGASHCKVNWLECRGEKGIIPGQDEEESLLALSLQPTVSHEARRQSQRDWKCPV